MRTLVARCIRLLRKEFEWSDFSTEHLLNFGMWGEQFTDADAIYAPAKTMGCVISALNGARDRYLDFKSRGSEWTELAETGMVADDSASSLFL